MWAPAEDEPEDPAQPAPTATPSTVKPPSAPTSDGKAPSQPTAAPSPVSPVSSTGKLSAAPATPWGQPAYQSVFTQPLQAPTPKNAPRQYQTQQAANASEQVLGQYQQAFGRSAAPAEIQHWVNQVGGGAQLTPAQLQQIQTEFRKAPEYTQYQGPRPTLQPGQFIPGVTLGTTLAQDPNQVFTPQAPSNFTPAPMTPRPAETAYTGTDFLQFLSPQYQGIDQAGGGLMQGILDNPDAITPEQTAQLKAQQQELINGRLKEAQAGQGRALAMRGLSAAGGAAASGERRAAEAATSQLAGAYRDIDLQAAQANVEARRQAASLGNTYLSGQMGRAGQQFGLTSGDAQAVAGSANQNWNTDQNLGLARDQFGFQAYMGQRGLDQDQQRIDQQGDQFGQGLNLDFLKFLESKYQGRQGLTLEGQRIGNQATQFGQTLGLNYDQLNADREMNFYNWLQRQQG
jgi:hypothetical protein